MESLFRILLLIILANIVTSFEQRNKDFDFSLKNLENIHNGSGEKNFLFNGASDDGQIYHINYNPSSKIFNDFPSSGEETIHAHVQNIVIPTQLINEKPEIEYLEKRNERIRRRKIGKGFLSVKTDIETI